MAKKSTNSVGVGVKTSKVIKTLSCWLLLATGPHFAMSATPVSMTLGLNPIPIFAAADDTSDKQQLKFWPNDYKLTNQTN